MSLQSFREITEAAWKIIDDAGLRSEDHYVTVSGRLSTLSDGSSLGTTFTISYQQKGSSVATAAVVDMFEAQNALITFRQKVFQIPRSTIV